MSNVSYTSIGEISRVSITANTVAVTSVPVLNAEPAVITIPATANTASNTELKIDTFGSLGKIKIVLGGTGYAVGEELIFNNKPMSFGIGAEAEVDTVTSDGIITKIRMVPSKIGGTVTVTSNSNVMVTGTSTTFQNDLIVGDKVMINGITRTVSVINSQTSMNLSGALGATVYGVPIRKYGLNLIGGQGYTQDKLPTITVSTVSGTGAIIECVGILGDGEQIIPSGVNKPGEIQEIVITDPGEGFSYIPLLDLSQSGNGDALATAELTKTYETFPGFWSTSDGIISSVDRKLQGNGYLVNYAYLTTSSVEFAKYKKIFKELLHPAGFKAFAEVVHIDDNIDAALSTTETLVVPKSIRTLSGTVNTNSTIWVTGTGTKFNVANSLGIISVGSYIAINSEIRIVDSILNNTTIKVTSAFGSNSSGQELVVMNTVYDAVVTETTLDEITAENEFALTVEIG
jgi:hypothetical protein